LNEPILKARNSLETPDTISNTPTAIVTESPAMKGERMANTPAIAMPIPSATPSPACRLIVLSMS